MSRITTVVFDMYETLAQNKRGHWIDTFRGICRTQGISIDAETLYREWKIPEMAFREQRLNLEEPEKSPPFKTYQEAWRDCFAEVFARLGIQGDAAAAAADAIRDMGLREPYADALEALPEIQAGWRTGVLSNADDGYLLPLLERLGWRFDAVLSSEKARAYKPLPSPFEQVMEVLGVGPQEAVYVGDTMYDDVLGAKNVGMRAVWVSRDGAEADHRYPRPDYQVRSLRELPGILRSAS